MSLLPTHVDQYLNCVSPYTQCFMNYMRLYDVVLPGRLSSSRISKRSFGASDTLYTQKGTHKLVISQWLCAATSLVSQHIYTLCAIPAHHPHLKHAHENHIRRRDGIYDQQYSCYVACDAYCRSVSKYQTSVRRYRSKVRVYY